MRPAIPSLALHIVAIVALLLLPTLFAAPSLPLLDGCKSKDWVNCRASLIASIFNSSSLPSRYTPDFVIDMPAYAMHGFPGPGDGVGDVSHNSWSNNMTSFVWTIASPFVTLNSTVYYTLNTSGRAPRGWPQDGPSMPGPSITPDSIGDTIVIYHNGHETNKCVPNFDGNVDYFNELGYDVMELFMPLYAPPPPAPCFCNNVNMYGCNAVPGIDSNHHWFHQWEDKGDFPIRFFIEPIILTINYALTLGYKHVVMFGLSGGGWSTTIAAAVDPRITLSIPVAGSVPKFPTELYPNMVPDLPEVLADFEQSDARPFYQHCSHVCMYALAALEPQRSQVQILHNKDPCCYSAEHLHSEIKEYNAFIHELPGIKGWFQTAVTAGNIHQVNYRDRVIVAWLIERLRASGAIDMQFVKGLPFDLLRVTA